MKPEELTAVAGSSQIIGVGHRDGFLYVRFKGGAVYRYPEAPAHHVDAIAKAESAGRYFNQHIRGQFQHEKMPT